MLEFCCPEAKLGLCNLPQNIEFSCLVLRISLVFLKLLYIALSLSKLWDKIFLVTSLIPCHYL